MQRIWSLLSDFADLHLTGNAYCGVGVPDCVRLAKETASRIASFAAAI
jgi:protoporphyrinogen oxidase